MSERVFAEVLRGEIRALHSRGDGLAVEMALPFIAVEITQMNPRPVLGQVYRNGVFEDASWFSLSVDKESIQANGADKAVVLVRDVGYWGNNPGGYSGPLQVRVGRQVVGLTMSGGEGVLEITSEIPAFLEVEMVQTDLLRTRWPQVLEVRAE